MDYISLEITGEIAISEDLTPEEVLELLEELMDNGSVTSDEATILIINYYGVTSL